MDWTAGILLVPWQPSATHWVLLVVVVGTKRVLLIDGLAASMSTKRLELWLEGLTTVVNRLQLTPRSGSEDAEKVAGLQRWRTALNEAGWEHNVTASCPAQGDSTSCAMVVIAAGLDIISERGWSFDAGSIRARRLEASMRMWPADGDNPDLFPSTLQWLAPNALGDNAGRVMHRRHLAGGGVQRTGGGGGEKTVSTTTPQGWRGWNASDVWRFCGSSIGQTEGC